MSAQGGLTVAYPSEYKAWGHMKERCDNPKDPRWERYGGRGITYCERWANSFSNFFADMGPRPSGMSLERTNNDLGYGPGNCVWATTEEQGWNKGEYKNNSSGVKGVSLNRSTGRWLAGAGTGNKLVLYRGTNFWDAVCARKSWEAQHGC